MQTPLHRRRGDNKPIFGAIALFLLDLLLRRVRLFDRKLLPKKTKAARA